MVLHSLLLRSCHPLEVWSRNEKPKVHRSVSQICQRQWPDRYDDEFIERITVYRDKEEKSDVDERETARYGSSIKKRGSRQQIRIYGKHLQESDIPVRRDSISDKEFRVPKELY